MSHKILLVDDEQPFLESLAPFLQRNGYVVDTAQDGEEALQRVEKFGPDLIILDVMMPQLNGREVCRRLRHANNWTPIIMLTQIDEAVERNMSLIEGADDYINKPLDPAQLVVRILALLRRVEVEQMNLANSVQLAAGPLRIDRQTQHAWLDNQKLPLKPKTFAVLAYLMKHAGEVLPRERLLDAVWGWELPAGTRTIDVRVAELRKLLNDGPDAPRFIQTIGGIGYKFIHPIDKDR